MSLLSWNCRGIGGSLEPSTAIRCVTSPASVPQRMRSSRPIGWTMAS